MQFQDSENAQHNLEIAQIPKLRGTYTSNFARSATAPSFANLSNLARAGQLSDESCCSPTASASAAACRLYLHHLLLPDCVRFIYCSLIVSASAAAP